MNKPILLLFLGLIPVHHAFSQKSKSKPNIVYILADDMGYGELGAYGNSTHIYILNFLNMADNKLFGWATGKGYD